MGNNSQRKILYAIICITALIGISYLTRDYWYPAMINNCRACGLKYFTEYSPTPSPNVTLIPHQNPSPTYTEPIPSTTETSPTASPTITINPHQHPPPTCTETIPSTAENSTSTSTDN